MVRPGRPGFAGPAPRFSDGPDCGGVRYPIITISVSLPSSPLTCTVSRCAVSLRAVERERKRNPCQVGVHLRYRNLRKLKCSCRTPRSKEQRKPLFLPTSHSLFTMRKAMSS